MRVAGYIRVSTAEQALHGYSLEAQTRLIESFCEQHGHKLVGIYADEGKSASKQLHRRTELLQMLADAEDGKIDLIAFKDLTRWSRNPSQFYAVQDRLDRAKVSWIAIEQPSLETLTAQGRLLVGISISVAAHESAQTSERIKFVNASRVKDGCVLYGDGAVALGYRVGIVNGKKRIVINEEMRQAVEDVFQTYSHTGTITAVRKMLMDRYGIFRTEASIRRMLLNPMYKGEYRDVLDYCEPYISSEQFDANQRSLDQHHYTAPKHVYIFSGLIKCAVCGHTMIGRTVKGIPYYGCPNYRYRRCSHKHQVREDAVEQYLIENIDAEVSKFVAMIGEPKKKKSPTPIRAKLSRLQDLYINGDLSREEYDRRAEDLKNQMKSVTTVSSRLKAAFPDGWIQFYQDAPKEAKNAAWRSVVTRIDADEKNNLTISFV